MDASIKSLPIPPSYLGPSVRIVLQLLPPFLNALWLHQISIEYLGDGRCMDKTSLL